jgi:hypothetical protein
VLADLARRLLGKTGLLPIAFYFLVSCYAYAALVMNISDHGENMRFRLSIEPIIWIITTFALTRLAAVVESLRYMRRKENAR